MNLAQVTNVALHLVYPLVSYALRRSGPRGLDSLGGPPTLWGSLLLPLLLYTFWQLLYLAKTEVADASALRGRPELGTSLRWMARDPSACLHRAALSAFTRLGLLAPGERFDPQGHGWKTKAAFVGAQMAYTVVCVVAAWPLYVSETAHGAALAAVFAYSAYLGGGFYVDVFAARYLTELEARIAAGSPSSLSAAAVAAGDKRLKGSDSAAGGGGEPLLRPLLPLLRPARGPGWRAPPPLASCGDDFGEGVDEEEEEWEKVPPEGKAVNVATAAARAQPEGASAAASTSGSGDDRSAPAAGVSEAAEPGRGRGAGWRQRTNAAAAAATAAGGPAGTISAPSSGRHAQVPSQQGRPPEPIAIA